MVSQDFYDGYVQKFYGLSTDTKPSDCMNGSKFLEMDTSIVYVYDEQEDAWNELDGGINFF